MTKARGGESAHNFGLAWDIGVFNKLGDYSIIEQDYIRVAGDAMSDQLQWGGDWKGFKDYPHYQLETEFSSMREVRVAFEAGKIVMSNTV